MSSTSELLNSVRHSINAGKEGLKNSEAVVTPVTLVMCLSLNSEHILERIIAAKLSMKIKRELRNHELLKKQRQVRITALLD